MKNSSTTRQSIPIEKRRIIENSFKQPFNEQSFIYLIKNIFNQFTYNSINCAIPKNFSSHIQKIKLLGKYKDKNSKKIDCFVVQLKKESSLDRARSKQRNCIAQYLKQRASSGALVAFVAPNQEDWRFSFIKMEYRYDEKKKKIKEDFTPARRYSFLVGANESSHTAQSMLLPLLKEDNKNPTLEDLEKAFSVEKVTKEFYEKYRNLFYQLTEALDKIIAKDKVIKKDLESKKINSIDFSKKLLGQIVFLYFLQKKGWFGVKRGKKWGSGSKHFLRDLFNEHCQPQESSHSRKSGNPETPSIHKKLKLNNSNNFFNDILEPLFYEALRLEHTDDYYKHFNCRIPFLNGGLFEPINGYDWVNTDILLPDSLFSNNNQTKEGDKGDGILDIFDRYNFTVKEDEPLEKEVAVDPEMLGQVFENLLEVKDRKSKGTYYTPREIVHYMCQESLINYLYSTLVPEAITLKQPLITPTKNQKACSSSQSVSSPQSSSFPKSSSFPRKQESSFLNKDPYLSTSLHLKVNIKKSDIEALIKSGDSSKAIVENAGLIDNALACIRVCDPAVGSGAFLVGMMNEIVRARSALTPFIKTKEQSYSQSMSYSEGSSDPKLKSQIVGFLVPQKLESNQFNNRTSYQFKRDAIQHCLYGVDIDSGAIEIAKLRLWLSLVVDEENRDTVQPLPNLDYKMVCGNALLGMKKDDIGGTPDMFYEHNIKELHKKKNLYFNESNNRKKQQYKQKIDQLISEICVHSVKGIKEKEKIKKVFDFEIYFSEVFQEKQGFDVVIANPPYVKEYVNKSAFDGLRQSPYYQGKMDLWYFFACKGIDISRPDSGVIAFIAQNNWVTSFGASKMRNKVIKDTQILNLIDFRDFKVFEAGIQTMVMLFKRNKNLIEYQFDFRRLKEKYLGHKDMMMALLNKEPHSTEQNQSAEYISPNIHRQKFLNKKLTFNNPEIENILNNLTKKIDFKLTEKEVAQGIVYPQDFVNKKSQQLLGDYYKVGDGIFVLNDREKKHLSFTKKELSLIKPHYTTKELYRWSGNPKNKKWVIYTDSTFKNQQKMKDYPNIKKHLDQFKKIITSDNKPYGLNRARKESFFKGEKIISVRKCAKPTFTYVDFDSYVSATFYVIKTSRLNLKYLTGIFNSNLIAFWLRHKGKMQGSNYQIDKEPIMEIPLIKPLESKQKPLIILVDKILNITKAKDYLQNPAKQAKVQEYEKQIDQLVYQLYDLTPEEIKIVENS